MVSNALHSSIDLVGRGYKVNPDWNRNFREDQDKVTRVIDKILDMELGEHIRKDTMLLEVYFTKYWGVGNYCFVYKMKEEYNQTEVLIGAIMESTDEVLRWYDLTSKFNFNIIIITPHRTIRKTYLDLLYEYVTMPDGKSIDILMETHPRAQQMEDWVSRYREYERVTRKTSSIVDPYSYRSLDKDVIKLLTLRDDFVPDSRKKERMNQYIGGIPKGYMSVSLGIEQRVIERTKVDKEWVGKLNKLLNKLKLKL